MNLTPSITPRERILTFGVQGTGKSNGILTIARRCPSSTFYVVDTELGNYPRLLATDYPELQNVEVRTVSDDWGELIPTIQSVHSVMGKDDWLVLDSVTPTWDWVQSWFTDKVFGKDIDEYFMDVRIAKQQVRGEGKDKKSLGAFEGWMDWPVINKVYFKIYTVLLNTPGHLYLTAEQSRLSDDDDKDVRETFGPYGVKPKGQKRLGHIPHTVLMLTKTRVGEYQMTTIKDRGRKELERMRVEDFGRDYLMKVAGWRPKAG